MWHEMTRLLYIYIALVGIFQKGKIPSRGGTVFCAGFDLESEITREKGHSNRFSNMKILFYLSQFLPQLR